MRACVRACVIVLCICVVRVRYYGVLPYFMAQSIYDTAAALGVPVLFGTIVYFMAGLKVTAGACVILVFVRCVSRRAYVGPSIVNCRQSTTQDTGLSRRALVALIIIIYIYVYLFIYLFIFLL